MNEVFRRRLIGLAILLVLVFVLSLLLPKDPGEKDGGDALSTTVSLVDHPAEPNAAPLAAPENSSPAAESATPDASPEKPTAIANDSPKAAETIAGNPPPALKPSPRAALVEQKPSAAKAAPAPPKPIETPRPETRPAPPKPKLAEAVATPAPPAPLTLPPPTTTAAAWYVQIGSFSDEGKATTILSLLRNIGYKGEVSKIVTGAGATLHRVRLGAYPSEAAAQQVQEKVVRQGYPQARVVDEGAVKKLEQPDSRQ